MTELTEFPVHLDEAILTALIEGTRLGLEMADVSPIPVGCSSVVETNREISIMVGLVGEANGMLCINLSQKAALFLASKMLFEEMTSLCEDTLDALCEIGNLIAGNAKDRLADAPYHLKNISLPSMIVGDSFNMHFAQGIKSVTLEYLLEDMLVDSGLDRTFTVTISLVPNVAP